jgi:hypothetical protein
LSAALSSRGGNAGASLLLTIGILFVLGFACNVDIGNKNGQSNESKPAKSVIPTDDKVQTLVKTTLMDFSDAVQEGDFTDFYKKVAKVWQDDSTPEEMRRSFKVFIDNKEDYNFKKAIAPLDATLSPAPSIQQVSGLDALVVEGYYPTKPERATFELKYVDEDGTWKLIGIHIKTERQ